MPDMLAVEIKKVVRHMRTGGSRGYGRIALPARLG
jgi:hypothetical protein